VRRADKGSKALGDIGDETKAEVMMQLKL